MALHASVVIDDGISPHFDAFISFIRSRIVPTDADSEPFESLELSASGCVWAGFGVDFWVVACISSIIVIACSRNRYQSPFGETKGTIRVTSLVSTSAGTPKELKCRREDPDNEKLAALRARILSRLLEDCRFVSFSSGELGAGVKPGVPVVVVGDEGVKAPSRSGKKTCSVNAGDALGPTPVTVELKALKTAAPSGRLADTGASRVEVAPGSRVAPPSAFDALPGSQRVDHAEPASVRGK